MAPHRVWCMRYSSFNVYWKRQVELIGCLLLVSTCTTMSCSCLSVMGCRLGVTVTFELSQPEVEKVIICATKRQYAPRSSITGCRHKACRFPSGRSGSVFSIMPPVDCNDGTFVYEQHNLHSTKYHRWPLKPGRSSYAPVGQYRGRYSPSPHNSHQYVVINHGQPCRSPS